MIAGFIEEVSEGTIYGRVSIDGEEFAMEAPLDRLEEGQRGYLEPGAYFTIVNGGILIDKTIWTTFEMEEADTEAERWARLFALTRDVR